MSPTLQRLASLNTFESSSTSRDSAWNLRQGGNRTHEGRALDRNRDDRSAGGLKAQVSKCCPLCPPQADLRASSPLVSEVPTPAVSRCSKAALIRSPHRRGRAARVES